MESLHLNTILWIGESDRAVLVPTNHVASGAQNKPHTQIAQGGWQPIQCKDSKLKDMKASWNFYQLWQNHDPQQLQLYLSGNPRQLPSCGIFASNQSTRVLKLLTSCSTSCWMPATLPCDRARSRHLVQILATVEIPPQFSSYHWMDIEASLFTSDCTVPRMRYYRYKLPVSLVMYCLPNIHPSIVTQKWR